MIDKTTNKYLRENILEVISSPIYLSADWIRKKILQEFTPEEIRKQNIAKLKEERRNKLNNLKNN
jgi:hypothetical protein